MKYIAYFDCGTTNSRIYLLDGTQKVVYSEKSATGARSNVATDDRNALTKAMYALYQGALTACGIEDRDVAQIYASGMVSSAYGLYELTHCELPMSVGQYADRLYAFEEKQCFGREIFLAPGMKRLEDDFNYVNNMRGEEMEVLGMLGMIEAEYPGQTCAIALPGSHTHVVFVRDGVLLGIVSNFTGELFHAVASETILAPVLNVPPEGLEEEWIRKGVHNLEQFGFNRALYVSHAMKIFAEGTPAQRLSYSEGVLLGGIAQSVDHYCERFYPDCSVILTAADGVVGDVYRAIFSTKPRFSVNRICIPEGDVPFSVMGLMKILNTQKKAQVDVQ